MRLLILSDIHGNWPALQAVLEAEPDPDGVLFCGDVVDYGPLPVECLRWVATHATRAVRGNHDNAVALGLDCQCMGSFREYSVATRAWHQTLLSEADREFLRSLPTLGSFEHHGKRFHLAHATPQGDLFQYLNMDEWPQHIAEVHADFVVLGHTHVQGMRTFGATTVVNPGSVGLARDHPAQACYAVYRDGQMQLSRIRYDVDRTVAALEAAPLPIPIIRGLCAVLRGPQ